MVYLGGGRISGPNLIEVPRAENRGKPPGVSAPPDPWRGGVRSGFLSVCLKEAFSGATSGRVGFAGVPVHVPAGLVLPHGADQRGKAGAGEL